MPTTQPTPCLALVRWLATSAAIVLIAACGGGQNETSGQETAKSTSSSEEPADASKLPSFLPTTDAPPSAKTLAAQREGARLNTAELAQIAKTGVIPKAFEGPLLSGARDTPNAAVSKAGSSRTAVYRFFNTRTNAHFFTTNTTERDNIIATLPFMNFEGPAFYAYASPVSGLSPVHRFYNTQTGVHFFTISESERANVVANLPQFRYEGKAYYASTMSGTGFSPLYRFLYTPKGFHFYTASLTERDNIIASSPQYNYEGVGYYSLDELWPAVQETAQLLPQTGVTTTQCYQAGSSTLVACNSAGAQSLSTHQDGNQTAFNPMQFGLVQSNPGANIPSYYQATNCVEDKVTGLIWEGKPDDGGVRDKDNTYTNLGGGSGDASAYVVTVNAMSLCGFNDWRLPAVEELQTIMDYGAASTPAINTLFFPNTTSGTYWTSTASIQSSGYSWYVSFATRAGGDLPNSGTHPVRLVRGTPFTGTRFELVTVPYTGDSGNNAVIDRKTGLTWRRCRQGQFWSGTTCTGAASLFNHEAALNIAEAPSGWDWGWRLPNIKELASLADRTRFGPALDQTVFPGVEVGSFTWSSTPSLASPSFAMGVGFDTGYFSYADRSFDQGTVRLLLR